MEPEAPKRLDYASPDVPESEDEGVRRYYREPPEFEFQLTITLAIFCVLGALAFLYFGWLWLRSHIG